MMTRLLLLALTVGSLFLPPFEAEAQTRILIDCPSGPPCEEQVLGHIDAVGTARLAWVATVALPANVCLQVTGSSDGTVVRSVIAPNGTVYRRNWYLEISPTPVAGWYTIQLDTPPPNREQIFNYTLTLQPTTACGVPAPGR